MNSPCLPLNNSVRTLVYLATPYSDPNPCVRHGRFLVANKIAAKLMLEGTHIFSPISHTHPIAVAGDLPYDWTFWEAYDRAILNACCKLIVLTVDGWQESKGIEGELKIAGELGIPIEYLSP